MDWSAIISKLLDKNHFIPAGALTALTIFLARHYGYLADLKHEATWIWIAGIFCGHTTLMMVILSPLQEGWAHFLFALERLFKRRQVIRKMEILNDRQEVCLWYVKATGKREFQAWDESETIIALRRMGFIRRHESTDAYFSRYSIPKYIWRRLPDFTDEQKARLLKEAPWMREMRGSRI